MLTIDGSIGEGGGQILRTALALSLFLQKPFRMTGIRRGRAKPGLRPQHLAAVKAAAQVGMAAVERAEIGSQTLDFVPRGVAAGEYRFDIGTAGSTGLVLQTVLPALISASRPSRLTLIGGTHNPLAPPYEFLQLAFLPLLGRMGPKVNTRLKRPGFYPAGGGMVEVEVEPVRQLRPLSLERRGAVRNIRAVALVSRLPDHVGARELEVVATRLDLERKNLNLCRVDSAKCAGNALLVVVESEAVCEVFTGYGERGVPAERVAEGVAEETKRYLDAEVPVGEHLADQLLPMALAGNGIFDTLRPRSHLLTNVRVVQSFLDIEVNWDELAPDRWRVRVS